jgi:hypothetical protein
LALAAMAQAAAVTVAGTVWENWAWFVSKKMKRNECLTGGDIKGKSLIIIARMF